MEELKIDHRRRNSDSSDVSFVSHRSIDPPPAFKRGGSQSAVNRSHHDATLMNPGPPAVYQLKIEKKYIDGNGENIRRWTYGQRDRNKQNKVILMMGEIGVGKTTLINTMVNHLLGVKFEDQEFYQITEEEKQDQSQSQTSEITVYEVFVEENPTSLTIIDTPGYAHTEGFGKEREIAEYLNRLFADKDGVHYLDAVCFVMKASQNRLSGKELYIFHSVLSLFGKDIKDNIVFLLTYSDGGPPADVLNAIEKAEIPCRRNEASEPVHFLFNNRQKEKRHRRYEHTYRPAWQMGERSMNDLLKLLEDNNRKSVQMTLDFHKESYQLEACIFKMMENITLYEKTNQELTHTQKDLKDYRDNKIENYENMVFTVNKVVKVKVPIVNEWWWNSKATCCSICKVNCHERNCSIVPFDELSKCDVMEDGICTVCACDFTKHVKENKKYVTKTETVKMSFADLIKEYEHTGDKSAFDFDKTIYKGILKDYEQIMKESKEAETEGKLMLEQQKIQSEKSKLLQEAYESIMSLSKMALKPDNVFTPEDVDYFIRKLQTEGKDDWIKDLEHAKDLIKEQKNKMGCRSGFFGRKEKAFEKK